MRRVLGALCALLALTVPALSADKGGPIFVDGPVAPAGPNWHRSGFYIGMLAGYDSQQLKADDFKFGETAFVGGAMAGYNWNAGGLVWGLEADYIFTGVTSKTTTGGFTVSGTNHFLASARARVGVPIGPALLYVTGGPAFTEKKSSLQAGPFVSDSRDLLVGAALGGGLEAELTRTMFMRLEAIHYVFPNKDVGGDAGAFVARDQQTTVRVGVGFKLN